jgi:hypothetical protein
VFQDAGGSSTCARRSVPRSISSSFTFNALAVSELSHNDLKRAALGAYLLHLFIGANPIGRGKTARQTRKGGDV